MTERDDGVIRLAIHGAGGRMGHNLVAACNGDPALALVAAFEHSDHADLGRDVGHLIGQDPMGVVLSADRSAPDFDVAIDFSRPDGAMQFAAECSRRRRALVIGTTGFDPAQRARLGEYAAAIPIVMAPNMGIGVNLIFGLVEAAARALGTDYDAEILESHHRHKVDAPSGTALHLGERVAAGRGQRLDEHMVGARQGHTGVRAKGDIGFAVVRGGDIVGEHTVLFAGEGERIEITHKAASRQVFAAGALRAAAWISGRPAGLYDMQDVLDLSLS